MKVLDRRAVIEKSKQTRPHRPCNADSLTSCSASRFRAAPAAAQAPKGPTVPVE